MTEFRRANTAVETMEKLIAQLAKEATKTDCSLSDEVRAKFVGTQTQLKELEATMAKMRRKCEARVDLDVVKAQLCELLPGTHEDLLKTAQDVVDSGGENSKTLEPLLVKAHELDGIATYGAKMVEKVLELLARFDAAQRCFDTEVTPHLAVAVANADEAAAEHQIAAQREAAAIAAAAAQKAEEDRRRPINSLLAESEQKLQAQRQAEEEAERQNAEKQAAQRELDIVHAAEAEALLQVEKKIELRLAEVGPDNACAEALVEMLAAPAGVYRTAVEALHGMLGGIAAEPADARRRMVREANEGFQQQLGRRPGVWFFLRGVGYEPRMRDSLPSGLAVSLGVGVGPPSERFLLLQEPDMMNDYEAWLAWHMRITAIASFLQDLQKLAFQRTARLGMHGLDVPMHGVLTAHEMMQRWEACCGRTSR